MNKKILRTLTALCAALVLMGGFSVTAFAQTPEGEDATDDSGVVYEEPQKEEPLTPDGNATLVDDFGGNKQLITVTTKNGNYFYILIDRDDEGENTVHFLNQVDESEIEEMTNEQREQEFRERMERGELSDDDEDYQAFLEKFEAKKTTDDCYTPENIYDVAKRWCLKKYNLGNPPVVRPFYPRGDYKNENYPKGCVVIDNPPFSIISEICEWYTKNGIAYFLFAPTLTFLGIMRGRANYVACGSGVVYENGASVNTSFVTNLGSEKIIAASDLREQMDEANKENFAKQHKTLPKYEYPDEVLTATMLCYMAAHGVSLEICADDVHFIRGLDAQKESGKALFGSGYLLSKKAAAEKAAAEKAAAEKVMVCDTNVWELSDREKKIVAGLGHDD